MNPLFQKVKGKAQIIKGDFQQQTGHGVKGGVSKLKGKVNEIAGDVRLRNRTRRTRGY